MNAYNITVVGGSGIVGRSSSRFSMSGNARGAAAAAGDCALGGKQVEFRGSRSPSRRRARVVYGGRPRVFLSASGAASKQFSPIAARNGAS
jgi:hypothetical protein